MQKISLVVAVDDAFAIGKDQQLLCHLPRDLKHFKDLTIGKPILMGRNTYESIGKPLPGRRNIVLTSQKILIAGVEIEHSLSEALKKLKDEPEIMIIGGAKIFAQTLKLASCIYLTQIHHVFQGADAFFPRFNEKNWIKTTLGEHPQDAKNQYAMTFYCYTQSSDLLKARFE